MTEDSAAKHRAKQTVVNLALSLGATLAIVLVAILVVPRDDSNRIQPIDYAAVAKAAKADSKQNLLTLELPQGWWVNQAKWSAKPADGVQNWKVGFVGPNNQYIGLIQAFGTNPTWLSLQTKDFEPNNDLKDTNQQWMRWIPGKGIDADPTLWTLELPSGDFVSLTGTATEKEFAIFANMVERALN